MVDKPKPQTSVAQKELDKAQEQFDAFDTNIKDMTMDRMNMAPKADVEPQTKLSQQDVAKSNDIYLKPVKTISSREKFNEKYREEYNFQKEYVQFIAENKEVIGEAIEPWTKKFPGLPAEQWRVPVNKPVWGPRYLAEQLAQCGYHVMSMQQTASAGSDGMGQYFGQMTVDKWVPRITATPVSNRRSIFMGANAFK